jgi:3-dehydroquinate synthase
VLVGAGLLSELPALLPRHCPAARYAIIADSHVAEQYGTAVRDAIARLSPATLHTFAAGESNKTRETWHMLTDQVLAAGTGRDGAVIALGGGVTGDLAGFVAATCHRGIAYVQVPTTLLAMIDSSIGGKTGVDTPAGKNLVGAFHQPRLVVADVQTLATLPPTQLVAGMAEALKHGAIADGEYFEMLTANAGRVLDQDADTLAAVVTRSVEIKARVVAEDEREITGRRAVLNFGHTVGHAIETVAGYRMLHGEAIAVGMRVEADLGVRMGVTDTASARRLVDGLKRYGLPTTVPAALPADRLVEAMRFDKKSRAGIVRASLIRRLGEAEPGKGHAWTVPVDESAMKDAIEAAR